MRHAASRACRRPALLLPLLLAAACGDSGGPDGEPTAEVRLEAATNTIEVGEQVQLTATALSAAGNPIAGKTFEWTSTNQAVATVSTSGLVSGQNVGQTTIFATSEGKSGSLQITVNPPTIPVISSVSPSPLVPGQQATITGENFSAVPTNNIVTFGGTRGSVVSASPTMLTVTVPTSLCVPGVAEVKVTVNNRSSNAIQQPAPETGTPVDLDPGEFMLISDPTNFCVLFAASGSSQAYLVGVQNISETAVSLQPIAFGGSADAGPEAQLADRRLPSPVRAMPVSPTLATPDDTRRAERWRRHRMAELQLRADERRQFRPADFDAARIAMRAPRSPESIAAATIPSTVNVGDVLPIRVPNRNASNLCQSYIDITAVVRAVGDRAVWLEDQANPSGGFTASDWQTLSNNWDDHIYPVDVDYFGQPSDIDQNSRVVIIVTKEVNKVNILGFATTADMQPRTQCPSSDFGEIFYARAPDPSGQHGDAYTRDNALADATILLAHEFTHIIQFSTGIQLNQQFGLNWELEGQATLAEEAIGHHMTGRSPGQNYGFDVAFTGASQNAIPSPTPWYAGGFVDLALFYGFNADCPSGDNTCLDTRIAGAPHECSWLELNNAGPCFDGREVYGVPWSLLRWLSDQFGPGMPGGEKELQRRLITDPNRGYATLANVTGQPFDVLLAQWAAALYVDDRIANADPRLRFTSWDLKDVADALRATAQLVPTEVGFANFTQTKSVRGGSTAYFRVSGAGRPKTTLRARAGDESVLPATMRMFMVRLQ